MAAKKSGKQFVPSGFRIQGIYEQYARAKRFVRLAHRCKKPVSRFRNLIAAVYPARAVVELMFEAARTQELKTFNSDEKLREKIRPMLPYYDLVYKIRIHDFHRFGCLPPQKKLIIQYVGGPITFKLKERGDFASMSLRASDIKYVKTGESSIELNRPLDSKNGMFFDDDSREYVPLDKILNDYLSAVPSVIEYLEECLR